MDGPRRYLCSHLVSVTVDGNQSWANLEEIWPEGAVIECESLLPEGAHTELRSEEFLLAGRISSVAQHEFGWRAELEFSPLTPWSLASFRPEHLLPLDGST